MADNTKKNQLHDNLTDAIVSHVDVSALSTDTPKRRAMSAHRLPSPVRQGTDKDTLTRILAQQVEQQNMVMMILKQLGERQGSGLEQEKTTAARLSQHFEDAEKRARDAWRATAEQLKEERDILKAQSNEAVCEEYLELSKASQVTADDSVTIQYLLYADEQERRFWASTLLRHSGNQRIRCHNFAVMAKKDDAFASNYGRKLMDFVYPLYPAIPAFKSLNTKLLAQDTEHESGLVRGGGKSETPSQFKRTNPSGGGYVPVHQFQDGSLGAETTPLEAANQSLKKQIQGLEKKVARMQESANSQGTTRGRQVYNRGRGGRGQYRGGHETLRGGDAMEGTDEYSTAVSAGNNKSGNNVVSAMHENKKEQPFRRVQ